MMEEELVSSLTAVDTGTNRSMGPLFLGFFLQPHIAMYPLYKSPPSAKFLHCSEEGKGLEDGEWGSLDASLSFLDMPRKHIMGSSNGLLLCCADFMEENSQYIVCNPVTREFNVIPPPHEVYGYVALTFICKRNDDHTSLDRIHYEILRVGMPNYEMCTLSTTYKIETFSSLNGEWEQSQLASGLPFRLCGTNVPGFVLDDVIYWKDNREVLVVYDRSKAKDEENIQVLELPNDGETITRASHLCLSEGKIHYARADKCHLELWVLSSGYKSSTTVEWVLKHKVCFTEMNRKNPSSRIGKDSNIASPGYLHPYDSQLIFLISFRSLYWYDFESGKLHEAGEERLFDCFLYDWPNCAPPNSDSQWLSRL